MERGDCIMTVVVVLAVEVVVGAGGLVTCAEGVDDVLVVVVLLLLLLEDETVCVCVYAIKYCANKFIYINKNIVLISALTQINVLIF